MKVYRQSRSLLFKVCVAIIVICVLTALASGGIILLNHLGFFTPKSAKAAEYYAVGKTYNTLRAATDQATQERAQGRAGCVLTTDDGFFVIYAVYTKSDDAEKVSEKLNGETQPITVNAVKFDGDDAAECSEALTALREVVTNTEKIWRELDEYKTSESLSVKMLKSYASALDGYLSASNGVGELCGKVNKYLTEAAEGESVSVSAGAKYVSAATAIALHDYTQTM